MKRFVTICLVGVAILFSVANLFAQWEPDVRLTFDNADSHIYYNNAWQIAAIGDTVHVVWCDERDGDYEIYYKRSIDGGTTWGIDTRLTYNPGTQGIPGIAVSGSYVHIVWWDYRNGDYEIYYKRSTDGGTTWGIDTSITNGPTWVEQPCIAVSGSNVHVVWKDCRHGDAELYYNRSTDGGTTWGEDTRLTDTLSVDVWFPSVAVLDSNVHVVWDDARHGNEEVYYKRSTDGGITWGTDKRLSDDDSAQSLYTTVAVSGSNVHVVWEDLRYTAAIYYIRSTDGGTTWGTHTNITNPHGVASRLPSVAASGSNVHVVWEDRRDGNKETYYNHSTDGGTTWETDTRLTDDSGNSEWATIAVSGSEVHVVWEDDRDGNDEIYYKRNPTGNVLQEREYSKFGIDRCVIYPNPFINSIKFNVSGRKSLQFEIYDCKGTLVDEIKGEGPMEWHPEKSTSNGVYFVKFKVDNRTIVKKIIKIK